MTGDQIRSHNCKSLRSKNTFNGDVCIVRAHTELMLNTLWRRAATQSKNYVISFFFYLPCKFNNKQESSEFTAQFYNIKKSTLH